MKPRNPILTVGLLAVTSVVYLIWSMYRHRSRINKLRKQGFPMPGGWSWITGHIFVLFQYTGRLPPLTNMALAIQELSTEFADTEMFLLDMWPAYPASIVVFNPEAAVLISQKYNLPKPNTSLEMTKPIVGGPSLLSMNGEDWKSWRSLFNPGFSATSLMEHIPYIVDTVDILCEKFQENAGQGIFSLDDFATRLTFDIIMKVTLDTQINYQRSEHILPKALGAITRWHSFWDPRILWNPLRPFVQGYYSRVMNKYISEELELHFAELRRERYTSAFPRGRKQTSIISLALEAFVAEKTNKDILTMENLDDRFSLMLTHQIRLFLFAGNDTTSSTIVFIYHMLSKHPDVLSKLREEHNQIFGTDISKAGILLKSQPKLLNQCRYTLAIIKETLRLYPPAANLRRGLSGVSLPTLNGNLCETDGFNIIINHQAIHQNPRIWPLAKDFLPQRWLVDPSHNLYPPNGAYRPFDVGPRACIGQNLTFDEMRVVLVMTARRFAVQPAYNEWDRIQAQKQGLWTEINRFFTRSKPNTIHGDRAYQTELAGTHPSDGYPCRVSLVE
ncbi:hypothetical protein EAF04_010524 [Stromatinia cepivora]|nr:hypothetical protein EAF04_010524 [Stromatinia cepivora]